MSRSPTLYLWGLPSINSFGDLAEHLRLSPGLLNGLVTQTRSFYRKVNIPKRDGSIREISCPNTSLKAVQRWILRGILDRIPVGEAAKGYRRKLSVRDNAMPHANNDYAVCLDLKDFFPSISAGRVFSVFRAIGYATKAASVLTSLCTLDGTLPQGAVTSPSLSNIVCKKMDSRLAGLAGRFNMAYTRYADDITFSSPSPKALRKVLRVAEDIIEQEGFRVNPRKTRIAGPGNRLRVTGVIAAKDRVRVPRDFKRKVRAAVFRSIRHPSAVKRNEASTRLLGYKAYWRMIEGSDPALIETWRTRVEHGSHPSPDLSDRSS